jgi:hypothetical protein
MEKATEEAARRGQAESARAAIEKDLDDVSAALFDQANTMVAEARLGRAQSDRRAEEAERALLEAEDAVRLMQQELQTLQGEKESAERRMETMNAAMGKGKWIDRASSLPINVHHLLTSHASYQEYISLLCHLRALRATYPQPPNMGTLLALPFIARLQLEDTYVSIRASTFYLLMVFQGPDNSTRRIHCPQLALKTFNHCRHPNWTTHYRTYCNANHFSVCYVSATASRCQCPGISRWQRVVLWFMRPWYFTSRWTKSFSNRIPLAREWYSVQHMVIVHLQKVPGDAIPFGAPIPSTIP